MLKTILKVNRKVHKIFCSFLSIEILKSENVSFHKDINIVGIPIIENFRNAKITLGQRLIICSTTNSNPMGLNHKTVIRTLDEFAEISIGNDVGISGASICAAEKITIGNNTMLGANVQITDTDFHPIQINNRRYSKKFIKKKAVTIEDNVWIGANSIILKGVTIGENSIIGAGSVVTSSIPKNCIAAGSPAKIIKQISAEE
ncbi:acyltransferase [Exiguobacterium undae]|uniref:Acyltransferase n=1 Tax=Exiguobacterium undae TaxID=169177 RepID=A0ABX2V831_9BACL|nr:acyltransferase [Exiguobacterium undae]OAN14367.1 hypothetical protein A3783_00135 [Exiguobacterium undae]